MIYFNFDGTFAYLAGANEGSWVLCDNEIILRFKRQEGKENNTVYSGVGSRNFMSGVMISSEGERGHWFALKKGAKVYAKHEGEFLAYLVDKEGNPKLDVAGNRQSDIKQP